MKITRRYDVTRVDKIEVTHQGFLKIPVFAARTGIQSYRQDDGTILREFRPAHEVFSEKTMASLANAPVTNDHPKEMVNLDNVKELMVGFTSSIVERVGDKFLKTDAIITDKAAIKDIRNGKLEVSMGYDVELLEQPGTFDGEHYDVIQTNIVHNHLAIVNKARGGKEVRLRLDQGDAISVADLENQKGDRMKIKIGDTEFEVSEDLGKAIEGVTGKLDKATEENETLKKAKADSKDTKGLETKVTNVTKENETLTAKVDALTEENTKLKGKNDDGVDAKEVSKLVRMRTRLEDVAKRLLSKEQAGTIHEKEDLEIKKMIILVDSPEAALDEKTDTYVEARYDHIVEGMDSSDKANGDVGDAISDARKKAKNDQDIPDVDKARAESMKRDQDAWKNPVGRQSGLKNNKG